MYCPGSVCAPVNLCISNALHKNTCSSLQGVLEKALSRRFQIYVPVVAAGRTDSGVHSVGQAIHFDLPNADEDLGQLTYSMNQMLPEVRDDSFAPVVKIFIGTPRCMYGRCLTAVGTYLSVLPYRWKTQMRDHTTNQTSQPQAAAIKSVRTRCVILSARQSKQSNTWSVRSSYLRSHFRPRTSVYGTCRSRRRALRGKWRTAGLGRPC